MCEILRNREERWGYKVYKAKTYITWDLYTSEEIGQIRKVDIRVLGIQTTV